MSVKVLPILVFVGVLMIQTSSAYDEYICIDDATMGKPLSWVQLIARLADNLVTGGYFYQSTPLDECENLRNGTQYYLQTSDGSFVVYSTSDYKMAILRAPHVINNYVRLTATKVGCNAYRLCTVVDGRCMSVCVDADCPSVIRETKTVRFHSSNSDDLYSRWMFESVGNNGEYRLKVLAEGLRGYMTHRNEDHVLTVSIGSISDQNNFKFVEAPNLDDCSTKILSPYRRRIVDAK